jgi:hypothetical protein
MITQYHFGKNMVSNKLEILFGTNKSKLGLVGYAIVTEQLESVTRVGLHLTESLAYELGIKIIIE